MLDQRASNAISASAITLVLTIATTALLLYFGEQSVHSILMIVLISLTCCVSLVMHFIFVGLAAQRLRRNVAVWVVLSILLFPIASIVGLILFEWFSEEKKEPPATA